MITEASPGNMGVVPPDPGFNQGLKDACRKNGALFISDEVMTGFRTSRAGWYGVEGVKPDLVTFGKVMGGGFPAAAFGDGPMCDGPPRARRAGVPGRHPLRDPVATAAGLAQLRLLTTPRTTRWTPCPRRSRAWSPRR